MADAGVTGGIPPQHPLLVSDAASAWLGIEVEALGDGTARIAMRVRPEMLNGFGMAHGGMVFAFADTAFALACNPAAGGPAAERRNITVAAGADISFLASTRSGDILCATAEHRGGNGRSGFYDIEVSARHPDGTGAVVALFRGRSRTIPNPALRAEPAGTTPTGNRA